MIYRVWNAFTQQRSTFDRNTRWDPYLTVLVSSDKIHWSMAKQEQLREIEAELFPPTFIPKQKPWKNPLPSQPFSLLSPSPPFPLRSGTAAS
jgi:hypothetical protein